MSTKWFFSYPKISDSSNLFKIGGIYDRKRKSPQEKGQKKKTITKLYKS